MKVLLLLLIQSVVVAATRQLQSSSVAEIIANDPELSILANALNTIAPSDALSDILLSSDFTLLAPTNAAFEALTDDPVYERVFQDAGFSAHLENLLGFHVASGSNLLQMTSVEMANGETISVNGMTLSASSNDATVIMADISATNGVVHKLDAVLLPAFWNLNVVDLARSNTLDSISTLTSFFEVLEGSVFGGIVLTVAQTSLVTMFAPTDEAFEELGPGVVDYAKSNAGMTFLLNVMQNHVVSGVVLPYSSLEDGDSIDSLRAGPHPVEVIEVLGQGESVLVADSLILEADILNVILSADDRATLSTMFPPPTGAPVVSPTNAPVVPPTNLPVVSPTSVPVVSPTNAPVVQSPGMPVVAPTTSDGMTPSMPVTAPTGMPVAEPTNMTVVGPMDDVPVAGASPTDVPVVGPMDGASPSGMPAVVVPTDMPSEDETSTNMPVLATTLAPVDEPVDPQNDSSAHFVSLIVSTMLVLMNMI